MIIAIYYNASVPCCFPSMMLCIPSCGLHLKSFLTSCLRGLHLGRTFCLYSWQKLWGATVAAAYGSERPCALCQVSLPSWQPKWYNFCCLRACFYFFYKEFPVFLFYTQLNLKLETQLIFVLNNFGFEVIFSWFMLSTGIWFQHLWVPRPPGLADLDFSEAFPCPAEAV